MQEQVILKCSCGGKARIRRKKGTLWIACSKCDNQTGYYVDLKEPFDTDAENRAIQEWNRKVKA